MWNVLWSGQIYTQGIIYTCVCSIKLAHSNAFDLLLTWISTVRMEICVQKLICISHNILSIYLPIYIYAWHGRMAFHYINTMSPVRTSCVQEYLLCCDGHIVHISPLMLFDISMSGPSVSDISCFISNAIQFFFLPNDWGVSQLAAFPYNRLMPIIIKIYQSNYAYFIQIFPPPFFHDIFYLTR